MSIIEKLSQKLDMKDIDWRVATIKEKGCQLLAYKDARVDMKRLDSVCGALWQSQYKRDSKGVLQCGIGIYIDEVKEWVWRWSNGTESFAESQKGEYSDAFKRAGFMWGIGRELYDVPFTWVTFHKGEAYQQNNKWRTDFKFNPNEWTWTIDFEKQKVNAVDKNGKVRVGFKSNNKAESKPEKETPAKPVNQKPKPTPKPVEKVTLKEDIIKAIADKITLKDMDEQQKRVAASFIHDLQDDSQKRPFMHLTNHWSGSVTEVLAELQSASRLEPEQLKELYVKLNTNQLPF